MLVGKEHNSLNLIIFIYSIINIRILKSSMQIWTLKYMIKKQLSKFENIFEYFWKHEHFMRFWLSWYHVLNNWSGETGYLECHLTLLLIKMDYFFQIHINFIESNSSTPCLSTHIIYDGMAVLSDILSKTHMRYMPSLALHSHLIPNRQTQWNSVIKTTSHRVMVTNWQLT